MKRLIFLTVAIALVAFAVGAITVNQTPTVLSMLSQAVTGMTVGQVEMAFINGDTVYYAPQSVYDYLNWQRASLPGAPFNANTNIPSGVISQLTNVPTVESGVIVNNWTATVNGIAMPFSRLYISRDAFKTALKGALQTKVTEAATIAALDTTYANSVDEIGIPVLTTDVDVLDFGNSTTSLTFDITNTGEGELDWTITTSTPKVTVSPNSGATQAETDTITVTVTRSGIPSGTYNPTVNIASDGGSATVTLTVIVP